MKKNIFRILSAFFCAVVVFGVVACNQNTSQNSEGNGNESEKVVGYADYNEKLLVGFDSQKEILEKTMGQKEIREYKFVTDEKYVTQGSGALKITHDSDEHFTYMPTAMDISPSVYVFFDKAGATKDFSAVKAVSVDIYNPQPYPVEVKLYFKTRIKEIEWAEFIVDTCYLLPEQMNHCVFDMHLDKYINFGIDDVQTMCLMLPIVQSKEEPITLYMDNLCLRTFKGEPVYKDQTLFVPISGGMITSFEDKAMFNKTSSHTIWAGWLPTQALTAFWNGNPAYVSEGKRSLGIIAPCHGDVFRMERSYTSIVLPEEFVGAYDFTRFTGENATIKVDVFFDSPIDNDQFHLLIGDFVKTYSLKCGQWNTIEFPMHKGEVAGYDWRNLTKIRFKIFQLKGAGNVKYYFDNIRVEG